jgi:cytidine deaminase
MWNAMTLNKKQVRELIALAREALEKAYAPYSGYRVGAAVHTESDNAYLGSNIENASYGLTVCAERVAIWKAISAGDRGIETIVIVAEDDQMPRPCGACLQVMAEFAPKDKPLQIVTASPDGSYEVHSLADYLPMPFQFRS